MQGKQIVTIVNFVRGKEPRPWENQRLHEPVRNQLALMKRLGLKGTFLLQYDALLDDQGYNFRGILAGAEEAGIEIGAWLELPRPLVEAAGLAWKGNPDWAWDWRADSDFLIGYTLAERERLIDAYMVKFKEIYNRYPSSVGAWIIDAHSLAYLRERYGVEAAAICRDQWGTDGYSLWGGYWGQAYYPSRHNVFQPARSDAAQVDLPVFRMLGSDPIRQYDAGLDDAFNPSDHQHVHTLEPVYPEGGGGSPDWVRWYLRQNYAGLGLSFDYAQAGQENSFSWDRQRLGINDQFNRIAELVVEGRLEAISLAEAGRRYAASFPATPASAAVALEDWDPAGDRRSIWYYSSAYRVNLYQEDDRVWIRDLRIFNEETPDPYTKAPCVGTSFAYETLALADGYRWSGEGVRAGLYPQNLLQEALRVAPGSVPVVTSLGTDSLEVRFALAGIAGEADDGGSTADAAVTGGQELVWTLRPDRLEVMKVDAGRTVSSSCTGSTDAGLELALQVASAAGLPQLTGDGSGKIELVSASAGRATVSLEAGNLRMQDGRWVLVSDGEGRLVIRFLLIAR
jgi:hypothetical protein